MVSQQASLQTNATYYNYIYVPHYNVYFFSKEAWRKSLEHNLPRWVRRGTSTMRRLVFFYSLVVFVALNNTKPSTFTCECVLVKRKHSKKEKYISIRVEIHETISNKSYMQVPYLRKPSALHLAVERPETGSVGIVHRLL